MKATTTNDRTRFERAITDAGTMCEANIRELRAENADALKAGPDAVIARVRELQKASPLSRAMESEPENVDEDERKVRASYASDAPYLRWFGYEILSHKKEHIDMSRMEAGAPVLVGHNTWDSREHVGVVEAAEIGSDGVSRADWRFSKNSDHAAMIYKDFVDRIRTGVSVGYIVDEMELVETGKDGAPDTYLVSWTPYENSIVPVAADISVGQGKAFTGGRQTASPTEPKQPEVSVMDPKEKEAADKAAEEKHAAELKAIEDRAKADAKAETERVTEILAAGANADDMDNARKAVENGTSIQDYYKSLL